MVEITVTRGLVQLKRLDDRIAKKIKEIKNFAISNKKKEKNVLNGTYTKESYTKKIKSEWQSIQDLIELRNEIKTAIVQSNSNTEVIIANKKYSVAQAIEKKSSIEKYDLKITKAMNTHYSIVLEQVDRFNDSVELDAHTLFGKPSEDKKAEVNRLELMNSYIELNSWEVIDPINMKELKDSLDKEVNDFLSEVDEVLSESNAITKITITKKPTDIE